MPAISPLVKKKATFARPFSQLSELTILYEEKAAREKSGLP
jgi:hypothetical protein